MSTTSNLLSLFRSVAWGLLDVCSLNSLGDPFHILKFTVTSSELILSTFSYFNHITPVITSLQGGIGLRISVSEMGGGGLSDMFV